MRLYEGMTLGWYMDFIRSIYPNWDVAYAQLLLKWFGLRAGDGRMNVPETLLQVSRSGSDKMK
jgi:hypothetical protein